MSLVGAESKHAVSERMTQALQGLARYRAWLPWNLLILLGGECLTRVCTLIAFSYLARVLRPEGFGQLETALAWWMLGQLAVELGYKAIGARGVAQHPAEANEWVARIIPRQLSVGLTLVALAWIASRFGGFGPKIGPLVTSYMLTLLLFPWLIPWLFQGLQRMVWIVIPQVVRQVVFLSAVITWVRAPDDLSRLPWIEGGALALAGMLAWTAFLVQGGRFHARYWAQWDGALQFESLMIGGSHLLWAFRNYLPVVLLGVWVHDDRLGLFAAPMRLVLTLQVLVMVYWTSEYPRLCQAESRSRLEFLHVWWRSCLQLTIGLAAVMAVCWCAAPLVLRAIYGEAFVGPESLGALRVALWLVPLASWRSHLTYGLVILRWQRWEFLASVVSFLLLPLLAWLIVPSFGVVGMAVVILSVEVAGALVAWWAWHLVSSHERARHHDASTAP